MDALSGQFCFPNGVLTEPTAIDFWHHQPMSKQQLIRLAKQYQRGRVPPGGRKLRKNRLRKKFHKWLAKALVPRYDIERTIQFISESLSQQQLERLAEVCSNTLEVLNKSSTKSCGMDSVVQQIQQLTKMEI